MKKNIQFIPDAELQIIFNILAGKTSSDVKELLEVNQKDKYPNLEQYSYKINNANWSLTLPETVSYTHLRAPRDRTRYRMPSSA